MTHTPDDQPSREELRQPTDPQAEARVTCPFCGSDDIELLSLFGSQLSTDQRYCRACHTPFEHFTRSRE